MNETSARNEGDPASDEPLRGAAPPVGVIGVGNMGLAIVRRLRQQGREVRVRDIDGEREALASAAGARIFATPAALAEGCAVVIVVVVDAAQAVKVLFGDAGAAPALPVGACVVLCPTIAPASTETIAARLATHGIDCIDAPMSGGPARAEDGSMSLMVACADAVFARHRDLIEALSSHVFRIGERPGDGARTKLVNNLLAAINLAGAAEALALAERVGLDPSRTLDVVERSSGQSWIGSDRLRRAIEGDFAPRAHTTLLRKDAGLALSMARQADAEVGLGARAAALFDAACAAGLGDLDDASLLPFLRDGGGAGATATLPGSAPRPAADEAAGPAGPTLDAPTAAAYAACALRSLDTPYPFALQRLMRDADDRPRPDEAHPVFCGSYDWHSSVHMQASLLRLVRLVPGLARRDEILAFCARRYTRAGFARELQHLEAHPTFERPYGWAWLLRLHDELRALTATHEAARAWLDLLTPLVALLRTRWIDHLRVAPGPQRAGVHSNSAFAMTLAIAHARAGADDRFEAALGEAARRWFAADLRYPARYEPSANDFLSGGLCAAVLMQSVLDGPGFGHWWTDYRPVAADLGRWLAPAPVGSRSDAQLVHADGLNLSRAWCLGRLARALPAERGRLGAARAAHLAAALPHVVGGDFVASHWLVSFALLALTDDELAPTDSGSP